MNEYKLTPEKRAGLVGNTIASIDVEDGAHFGGDFTITFTDGSTAYFETEGYEGIDITVSDA